MCNAVVKVGEGKNGKYGWSECGKEGEDCEDVDVDADVAVLMTVCIVVVANGVISNIAAFDVSLLPA